MKKTKTCKECGNTRPAKGFHGLVCKECRREYYRQWRARSKDWIREYNQKYHREKNIERASKWNKANAQKHNDHCMDYYHRLQDEAIRGYGGYRCACCGETEPLFLTLDHINNDGQEHRKKVKNWSGAGMYKWIIKHNFPPIFQVYCFNCNLGKRRNHGICPHQKT